MASCQPLRIPGRHRIVPYDDLSRMPHQCLALQIAQPVDRPLDLDQIPVRSGNNLLMVVIPHLRSAVFPLIGHALGPDDVIEDLLALCHHLFLFAQGPAQFLNLRNLTRPASMADSHRLRQPAEPALPHCDARHQEACHQHCSRD